jgi:hypothetical protein
LCLSSDRGAKRERLCRRQKTQDLPMGEAAARWKGAG